MIILIKKESQVKFEEVFSQFKIDVKTYQFDDKWNNIKFSYLTTVTDESFWISDYISDRKLKTIKENFDKIGIIYQLWISNEMLPNDKWLPSCL